MCPHFLSYLVCKSHYLSNFSEMLTFNSEGQPLQYDTPMGLWEVFSDSSPLPLASKHSIYINRVLSLKL